MFTTVSFTVDSNTGNFMRLTLAMHRFGFKASNLTLKKSVTKTQDIIRMTIESQHQLSKSDFNKLVSSDPNIVAMRVGKSIASVKTATSSRSKNISSAEKAPVNIANTNDNLDYIKVTGRNLITAYPNILQSITKLESEIPASKREDIFLRLGIGIGRWQYKKNHALGAQLSLDNVVQRSLKLALSSFLNVTAYETTISIKNCPHCAASRETSDKDCFFIKGFIQGFMQEIAYLDGIQIYQQLSKKTGSTICSFNTSVSQ